MVRVVTKRLEVTKPKILVKVPRGKIAIITSYTLQRKGIDIEYDFFKAGDGEVAYDGWDGFRIFEVETWGESSLISDLFLQDIVTIEKNTTLPNLRGRNIVYRGWGCTDGLNSEEEYDRSLGLVKEKTCDVTITLTYLLI